MKTKRAYLTAIRKFEFREDEISAGPGEVLVRIESCGLCGWELNHWKGILGTCPQTLGHEWGGTIVETGKNPNGLGKGDRITGLPENLEGFAEFGVFKADHCFRVSSNVPSGHAVGEPLKCVVTVLRAASPEIGDTGVILGCGAMGLLCIQALRGNIPSRLVAIDVDETRLVLARQFGATDSINASKVDMLEALQGVTGGRMADFAIEGTGVPQQLEQAIRCVRQGRGRVILMSSHERAAAAFDLRPAIERSVEIRVAHPAYSTNPIDDLRRAVNLLNDGVFSLERILTNKYPLADIQDAFADLESKPAGYIKGIVIP